MTERKVASKQERLMFEQLIRQDMQNGIQRTISNTPKTPSNYNENTNIIQNENQNQIRKPNSNLNIENDNNQNLNNININANNQNQNRINYEPKRTLAQKFNIRTNKGKRDAVWEQKRRIKIAKYEQLMQEEQLYSEQQSSPKMTPQNNPQRMTPREQYQKGYTPNNMDNQPRMTPQQEYQRRTPSNQENIQRMTPREQYNNNNNMQRMTPRNQYQRKHQ